MVLVRHWAVLYQQMGKHQRTQGQLTERIAREFFFVFVAVGIYFILLKEEV